MDPVSQLHGPGNAPIYDEARLRELVLHVAIVSATVPNFDAVKMNRVLFYADFIAFRWQGHPITGAEYVRLEQGPVPTPLAPLLERMTAERLIAVQVTERSGYPEQRIIALREPQLDLFSAREIALVDRMITAKAIGDVAPEFVGWRLAAVGESIPYAAALVGHREPTEAERAYGLTLEAEARASLGSLS